MRNLSTIRQAANKKSYVPQISTATLTPQDHFLDNIKKTAKKLQTKYSQAREIKRVELVNLNNEIEKKTREAKVSGDGIVAEARQKASNITNQARKELGDAEGLKKSLEDKLVVATEKLEEYQKATDTTKDLQVALKASQGLVEKVKAEISLKEAETDRKLSLTKELLVDMVALIGVTIEKVTKATLFAGEVKAEWANQLSKLDSLAQLVLESQAKNEAKEEHLEKTAKQLQEKEAIIKEQRLQLQMAQDELKRK
mgnify:CR=1 FL=1